MRFYLGVDVGSISTNIILMSEDEKKIHDLYIRTAGNPIKAVQSGMKEIGEFVEENDEILGVGSTGSARHLTGIITGADVIKNEITAHAKAAIYLHPDVKTVLEIGGQDSKIIIIDNQVVVDFAMNSVCAAGCGAFLDTQAGRLGIPIGDFGELSLRSVNEVNIAGRCTVFAESDMIHKQQTGAKIEDIIWGLCRSMVRNYMNNIGKGKDISGPIIFQGGVSQNIGIKKAFEEELGEEVIVPKHNKVMGALGSALLAKDEHLRTGKKSGFRGWNITNDNIECTSFSCTGCPNKCEVIEARINEKVVSRWGDRCGKWSQAPVDTV